MREGCGCRAYRIGVTPSPSALVLLKPCPYCGNGPLVFVACPSCRTLLAWCGEEDHAVGRFDGIDLKDIGTGPTRDWARQGCPVCGHSELQYAAKEEVDALGFPPDAVAPERR